LNEAAAVNETFESFDWLSVIANRKCNVETALKVRKARSRFHETFYDLGFPAIMARSSALEHAPRRRRRRGVV